MGAPNQSLEKPFVFERRKENVLICKALSFESLNVHSLACFVIVVARMQLIF